VSEHPGFVDEDGTLEFERPDLWAQRLEGLKGKRVRVLLKKRAKGRSIDQNSLYWGAVLKPAADQTGNDIDDIHNRLKEMHLVPEIREVLGKQVVSYTTTTLSIEEFGLYLEKCRATLAQFGVSLE